jgi:hypothetical protein
LGKQDSVTIAVYRLNLGVSTREYIKELHKLFAEVGPADLSIIPLPVKIFKDLASGRKAYASYRKSIRTLLDRIPVLGSSGRVYVSPVAVQYGGNSFISVVEATTRLEVSRKFIQYGGNFKGFLPKSPGVDVFNMRICFLVLDDIMYPEVARYCSGSGSSVLVGFYPPVEMVDPELVVLAARMRAYENDTNIIVAGGYTKSESIPTLVVRRDGNVIDMTNDSQPEVLSIQLAQEVSPRPRIEALRTYYAKAIKVINSLPSR